LPGNAAERKADHPRPCCGSPNCDDPEIAKLALYALPFVEFTEQGVAMPSVFRYRRRAALRDAAGKTDCDVE
jgi:hypothetical protein